MIVREPPHVVYVDSYTILGQYSPVLNRIELSLYLKSFPELHEFVLGHERKHAGQGALQACWLDVKDNVTLQTDPLLHGQLKELRKPIRPKTLEQKIHCYSYNFLQPWAMMLVGIPWWILKLCRKYWALARRYWGAINSAWRGTL